MSNTDCNRLVLWPSILTRNGWIVEKWPAGATYGHMTKISPEEDKKITTPARETVLTDEEWKLNIRQLVEKYPLPDAPWKRQQRIMRSPTLTRNTREIK